MASLRESSMTEVTRNERIQLCRITNLTAIQGRARATQVMALAWAIWGTALVTTARDGTVTAGE